MLCRTRGVDLDVAIYMGLSADDVKDNGGSQPLLEGLWPMFSALKDPKRQTAVVNLDGKHISLANASVLPNCFMGGSGSKAAVVLLCAESHH